MDARFGGKHCSTQRANLTWPSLISSLLEASARGCVVEVLHHSLYSDIATSTFRQGN